MDYEENILSYGEVLLLSQLWRVCSLFITLLNLSIHALNICIVLLLSSVSLQLESRSLVLRQVQRKRRMVNNR
jgi:hypothetical protein